MSGSVSPSLWTGTVRKRRGVSTDQCAAALSLVCASAADHPGIEQFLTAVFQGPSPGEFRASLEDPFYEPHDRLLLKYGSQIAAHVHTTRRLMQFGSLLIPVAGLSWLGVLPEFRDCGHALRLLAAAENEMASHGSLVGVVRTRIPYFFRRTGWAMCGRHSYCQAGVSAVLARMLDRGLRRHRRRGRLNVRCWRRMEMPALLRIYNQNLIGTFGPLQRTEAYWQWLISRRAYDSLYVALDGPDLLELEEKRTRIVGYAVTRGHQILEMLTAPESRKAAVHLLARACGDAIERGHHCITFHAPAEHRLHKLFHAAGGWQHHHEVDQGEVLMARLLAPVKLLRHIEPELRRRLEGAGLPQAFELGLLVDGKKYQLTVSRQGISATAGKIGRSYLRMNVADFTRLLMGQLDWKLSLSAGRLEASTALALEAGRALFPTLRLWRPPFDDVTA